MGGLALPVLTMDTDWAPGFVLDYVLDLVRQYRVPVTLFCTSAYELPTDLAQAGLLEASLHPNFMADSTQGAPDADERGRLRHLLRLHPEAVGSRSHRFFWHSGLRAALMDCGLRYDASIFCPLQSHLVGYDYYGLMRYPTWWADGYHLLQGMSAEAFDPPGFTEPGLKILNFHPIHVYLNTSDLAGVRRGMAGMRLHECEPRDLDPLRAGGFGVQTLFVDALRRLAEQGRSCLMRDLLDGADG